MNVLLCLKPDDWPVPERERWQAAIQPAIFLRRVSAASTWSVARQRIVAQAVGQWFAWLQRNGLLHQYESPADRLTEQRAEDFVKELVQRVSSSSAAMMVGALKRGYDVLEPEMDLRWLERIASGLKAEARPSRDRFAHLVTPGQLMDLGLRLMVAARRQEDDVHPYVSTLARDGLMLTMLIAFPVRIRNFASIRIGEHLLFQQDRYVLRFTDLETKVNRDQDGELPVSLTPWIDWYLEVHRRRLVARGSDPGSTWLWVNRSGQQLQDRAIRSQIEIRTRTEFGRHLWPHLFRAAAVTGFVDVAPEDIAIASGLLGHASVRTTERYYILARGNAAHQAVQSSLIEARSQAKARLLLDGKQSKIGRTPQR